MFFSLPIQTWKNLECIWQSFQLISLTYLFYIPNEATWDQSLFSLAIYYVQLVKRGITQAPREEARSITIQRNNSTILKTLGRKLHLSCLCCDIASVQRDPSNVSEALKRDRCSRADTEILSMDVLRPLITGEHHNAL